MSKKILTVVLAFTFLSLNIFSEEEQKKAKKEEPKASFQYDIVVTATRLETQTKEIASSITVITKEDLERAKKTTVLEALQEIMGATVIQVGPPGGAASVLLRGANSEHTLVMMDGVELNDPISPSHSCDISHLSLSNIERIEILRGSQSTLYGSNALGGVINIISKEGQGKPKVYLSAQGGSYGTLFSNAELSGGTDKIHFSLGASHIRMDGFSASSTSYEGNEEEDGYQNLTLSGRLGVRLLDNLDLDFAVRTIKTESDIDNFGGAFGDDPNNTQTYDSLIIKGQIRGLFFRNRWEQKLNISYVDYDRKYKNPTDDVHPFDSDNSDYKSNQWNLDWQHNLFLHETNILTFGVEYQEEQGQSEYYSESMWGPYSSIFPPQKAHNTGVFIQDQIRLADRFFATIGGRVDNHSQAGSSITYRIAPAYFIEQTGTKFKATYGTGFKSPSLYQLYAPGTFWGPIGNEYLKPEESTSWDVGIEQKLLQNKLILSTTYFSSSYENLIDFDYALGYINIRKATAKGAEFICQAWPTDNLSFRASYTKTEAKDEETDDYLLRRPKDMFTAKLNFNFMEKGTLILSLIQISEREDNEYVNSIATRITMPSYTLLNATVSYDIIQNTQIFFRLDNILNEEYEVVKGYSTPGFSAYIGFKTQF